MLNRTELRRAAIWAGLVGVVFLGERGVGALGEGIELPASDGEAADAYGNSVSVDGGVIAIGAPGYDVDQVELESPTPGTDVGAVYIRRRQGTTTTFDEEQIVNSSTRQTDERFGTSVDLDGDTMIVGAPGYDFGFGPRYKSGRAYIFTRNATQWFQDWSLETFEAVDQDEMGASVAISGDWAVVGAPGADVDFGLGNVSLSFDAGEAHVFRFVSDEWEYVQTLTASDGYDNQRFGAAVAIDGTRIVVGAPGDFQVPTKTTGIVGAGAYVFDLQGNVFVESCKVQSDDFSAGDQFGASVALDGDDLIVGAPGAYEGESFNDGAAYVFRRNVDAWPQQRRLNSGQVAAGNEFGRSVGLSSGVAIAGSPNATVNDFGVSSGIRAGIAEVFRRSGTTWTLTDTLTRSGAPPLDEFGRSVSLDSGLFAVGTPLGHDDQDAEAGIAVAFIDSGNEPPPNTIRSFILPKSLKVTVGPGKRKRPAVKLLAYFDTGPDEVDFLPGGTLTIGPVEISVDEMVSRKKGKLFTFEGQDLKLKILPSKYGTSNAKMVFTLDRDLAGMVDLEGPFELRYEGSGFDARGSVRLANGAFKFGQTAGSLISPELEIRRARANLPGIGRHGFKFVAGFTTTNGTAPDTPPDVTVAFGDVFHATIPGSELTFNAKKQLYTFFGNEGGITEVILDYAKERIAVKGKNVDLGDVPNGPQPLLLILTRDDDERAVLVRSSRTGKALRY